MSMIEKPADNAVGVKWHAPSVHQEGYKFVGISAAICAIFAIAGWETLAWPMAGITIWVALFFRDPIRVTPADENMIIAPADGMVTLIREVLPPPEMRGENGIGDQPMTRVSIFMSVFDVHINRTPIGGTIKDVVYISGKFLNADLDKASEDNERQHILVEDRHGRRIGFTQIAGLVARRILPFVKRGDIVAAGQRIGLIRFGSRVDVYLPAGTGAEVVLGQRTIAGETILGRFGESRELRGMSQ